MNVNIKIITGLVLALYTYTFSGCARDKHVITRAITNSSGTSETNKPELPAFFDAKPTEKSVSYLFAPGITSTEVMMGSYCPLFTAITGEKITWRSGGQVIGQPHSAVVFPEIDLHKPCDSFTLNPITAFFNGMRRDLSPLIQRYFQDTYDFTVEYTSNSPKSVIEYNLKLGKANVAQRNDIKALRKEYCRHAAKYPDTDIVLYGYSRGAATIFNFITEYELVQVKAAVLEGCFDTIEHCIKHFLYSDKERRAEKRLYKIFLHMMGSYTKSGPFPRDYADLIDDKIPVLFVTSLKDSIVPSQSSISLYKKLKKRGHANVHLLVLKNSGHSMYMLADAEDKKNYESVVHAFYKHYNLPHNSIKAAEGKNMFELTQPSVSDIAKLYVLPACSVC